MRYGFAAALAAMVVALLVAPVSAAPEDDVQAALDALLEAASAGDGEAFGALLNDEAFLFVDGTGDGDATLLDKPAFVDMVIEQTPPAGLSFVESDIQVRDSVAGVFTLLSLPGEGSMPCVGMLSLDEDGAWTVNALAMMPNGSETGAGATAAGDIITNMQTAIDEKDAGAAISSINADPFVAVVGLTGDSMVMADSTILTLIFSQMASADMEVALEWSEPEVFGNSNVGCAHLTIDVDAGEMMQANTEVLFLAAKLDGEWVLPAGAISVEVPEGMLDEDEEEEEADEQ